MRIKAPKLLNRNQPIAPTLAKDPDKATALAPALRTLMMKGKKTETEARRILGLPVSDKSN